MKSPLKVWVKLTVFLLLGGLMIAIALHGHAKQVTLGSTETADQTRFITQLTEHLVQQNALILQHRQKLVQLRRQWQEKKRLSGRNRRWLKGIARVYCVSKPNFRQATTWDVLLRRVDVVPASIALAIAIIQSDWGRSAQAKRGDVYGEWCPTAVCQRPFAHQHMHLPLQYVTCFITYLNVDPGFKTFRSLRFEARQQAKPLNGVALAAGLESPAVDATMVKKIQAMIRHYGLGRYDVYH